MVKIMKDTLLISFRFKNFSFSSFLPNWFLNKLPFIASENREEELEGEEKHDVGQCLRSGQFAANQ